MQKNTSRVTKTIEFESPIVVPAGFSAILDFNSGEVRVTEEHSEKIVGSVKFKIEEIENDKSTEEPHEEVD